MKREMTCILCPMGCRLEVTQDEAGAIFVTGNTCKRGAQYGEQEFLSPMRVVTSSVRVAGGARPLCSVKTAGQVPKQAIGRVLGEIRSAIMPAPVAIGQVLLRDVAGTGVNLVATSNCAAGG